MQNQSSYLTRGHAKVAVQVAYTSDVEHAMSLLVEAVRGAERVLEEPAPTPYLVGFGADGIDLELGFWIADAAKGTAGVRSAINRNIWRLFVAHGISIPFPQREVRVTGLPHGIAPAGRRKRLRGRADAAGRIAGAGRCRAPLARKHPRAYCTAARNIHFLQRLGTDEVKSRPTTRYAFIFLTQVI